MEGPAEGREPPPAKAEAKAKTKKQKPLFIGGIRCCPRCMTGGPRGKGGKHYSHDREAEDCVLRGSEAQGGMARKILKDAAENYEWEKGTKGILEPHRADKRRRGTRTRPTRPAVPAGKPKPRRRTKRGKAIKARPATTTTSKSKAAPPPRAARRNTKRKRPTTPPSSSSSSSSSSTTQEGTGQPGQPAKDRGDQDSDDLLSSEEVIQDVALLDILNYQHPDDKTKKHNKRKKRREEKSNDTKAETAEHPPRRGGEAKGVDPRSVGAAPAIGPFTASTSLSARGNTTMGEQALYQQARAKRREVEDYEQTQHLGKGEAYRPMPQLRHWVPGTTKPAEPSEPPRRGGQKGGKPPYEGLTQKVMKLAAQMDQPQ